MRKAKPVVRPAQDKLEDDLILKVVDDNKDDLVTRSISFGDSDEDDLGKADSIGIGVRAVGKRTASRKGIFDRARETNDVDSDDDDLGLSKSFGRGVVVRDAKKASPPKKVTGLRVVF